ncbi:MAG TPA: lipid-A-disaccharide synthase [Bacillota bacterium]|jgi:lipid-A-disaccharide synthase|nr:lipid-A-disaccharide synthase [Bacillota bacterium]HOL09510.1 lipid-A-disaccharide synthase [Bacillota bacterium]HPO97528.1 lipid-A-disaccharide synthase [Bacillota bacterium]
MRRIFISTCEYSGDMHGEALITELKKLEPELEIYGVGGSRMANAGMELILDPTKLSTIGFIEALKNFRRLKRLIREIVSEWEKRRPDVVVWLDSWAFNLELAKAAKKMGIPVVCIFSPSAWAYGAGRAKRVAENVTQLLAVLPFEADFYRKYGVRTEYIGHPLYDRVQATMTAIEFRAKYNLDPEAKILALLPGSRRQEIARLLPVMLDTVKKLDYQEPLQLVLPVAGSIDRSWLETLISESSLSVRLIEKDVYNLMAAADAAIIASGTATLEAALLGVPMVIVYQVTKLSYFIYKRLQTAEHKAQRPWMIGLPNLIAGSQIVPEIIQHDLTPENVLKQLEPLLNNRETNLKVRAQLNEIRERVGPAGVMSRAATKIIGLIDEV